MSYKEELVKAMNLLGENDQVIFIGQTVLCIGSALHGTLVGIPIEKKIEFPVAEEMQLGMSLGLALANYYLPVSIFPRVDFLILAMNQLVNHLDKLEEMSCGQWKPKVIIRTAVGSTKPLYPGPQHCMDHTEALRHLVTNIDVVKLTSARSIVPAYLQALRSEKSTILVEMVDLYNE